MNAGGHYFYQNKIYEREGRREGEREGEREGGKERGREGRREGGRELNHRPCGLQLNTQLKK